MRFGLAVGLGGILEVEDAVDLDLEPAVLDQVAEAGESYRVGLDQEAGGAAAAVGRRGRAPPGGTPLGTETRIPPGRSTGSERSP